MADRARPAALPVRERLIIGLCLAVVVGLAWLYLATVGMELMPMPAEAPADAASDQGAMAGMDMSDMDMSTGEIAGMDMSGMDMAAMGGGAGALSFGLLAAMWIVMMIGMMLPSASPMVVMMARLDRAQGARAAPLARAGWFSLGYVLAWTGFSLVAAAVQVGLQQALLLGAHDMALASPIVSGAVLIAAGLYQWTPLKTICLAKCRSPVGFLLGRWRPGARGALALGLEHGLYCLGCCWVLMALLFVAGVMALPWVAALAALVLVEKLAPSGEWFAKAGGVAMAGAGIYLIVAG
jgi:predicted metal-binding membrane protein